MDKNRDISKIPTLITLRLTLREINSNDADNIFEYASVPETSKFLLWYPHQSIQDTIDFIKMAGDIFLERKCVVLGIELKEENKLIGTIDIRGWAGVNNCAEVGYVIAKKYWGLGITTEALRAVIKYCFEVIGLNRVEAHCEEENTGSWRVMEKCGMSYEGTLRERVFVKEKYRSMKMYSILRTEYKT